MNFAVASQKSPSVAWQDLRSERKKKNRRGSDISKKAPSKISNRDFSWSRILFELASKLFLAGVVIYLFYASYNFMTTDTRFQITDITLSGNQALPDNQILDWLGPIQGENIFKYDLSQASTKLAEHPWILSASVLRKFPQQVQIDLIERVPYARIQFEKTLLMDNFGVILSEEKPEHQQLPLIKPVMGTDANNFSGEKVIQSLKTMHYFNKLPFFANNPLDIAELKGSSRIVFFTHNRDLQIQMSLDALKEGFKKFMIVLDTLEGDNVNIKMIDLSFKDQVVVRDHISAKSNSMKKQIN
ncbi:MAG: FtsQ-type POTRA domain-containing protein [Nitrospinaceae bacterium]|nr:FtsQ-type POTRA domain-containing protein [Nitrospina sp.]MBT5377180.1 FtsQ-type POTRA domain-containing protein [Nitrospinaceae bacterium]MBT5867482.1 FtsQ-type POTRA domain-containing protein [Nitrospinaceae bacterium]MBT6345611.1 FtsQ-type POTRA domain-containing protein [Nitrospina sp.]